MNKSFRNFDFTLRNIFCLVPKKNSFSPFFILFSYFSVNNNINKYIINNNNRSMLQGLIPTSDFSSDIKLYNNIVEARKNCFSYDDRIWFRKIRESDGSFGNVIRL